MIDLLTIFHRGGAVLYTRSLSPVPGCPVDNLISSVLLEERAGQLRTGFRHDDKYTVKWSLANDLDLVFVAVYLNLTNLLYMDDLLSAVRDRFCSMFREAVLAVEGPASFRKFNRVLEDMVAKYEMPAGGAASAAALTPGESGAPLLREEKKPAHAMHAKKNKQSGAAALTSPQKGDKDADAPGAFDQAADSSSSSASAVPAASSGTTIGGVNMEKLLAMQNAARGGKPTLNIKKKVKAPSAGSDDAAASSGAPAPKKKVMAQSDKRVTKADLASLDYTKKIDGDAAGVGERPESGFEHRGPVEGAYGDKISAEYSDDDEDDDDGDVEDEEDDSAPAASSSSAAAPAKSGGGFFSYFKTLVSGKVLTRDDLTPILQQFKENLNGKNVAAEISEHLAESVIKTLEGQKLASFTSVKSMVKTAVEAALTRILTPNRQIDVLQGVVEANEQKRPYSVVFVGVNGVGKSTSLAKTASYFLSKDLTVGVGACDTFRAGAIEQLRTHTKALNIPLYARGYDRDAASVAQDAIAQARRDGLNVVLIDTAGRMQHNEPLMRALAKLITLNKPDLVLFVGEALVGNDAVDQVREFNRCLADLSEEKKPRLIDGIILTKFDTIDDKVGAAISMAYVTGQPILFVGTGQTYKDLKRMNVKTLIRALLK